MKKYVNEDFKHLIYGADYNPEQWLDTPEVWDEDMLFMKKARLNEMTVGIFSWAYIEPKEGVFDFSLLDNIIEKIYNNGGRVILATPSAARPVWMVKKYPEVMRVNERGERLHFRDRHNHCYTSPIYREKVRIINEKLGERYARHPAVIAWHISNEYGGACYCDLCKKAFQEFLKKRYGDITRLNHEYWTGFWSLKYDSFEDVEPPTDLTVSALCGLKADWKRFVSYQTADFMRAEIQTVKAFNPDLPVTTNMMPDQELDYFEMAKDLDIISWDSYPDWTDAPKTANEVSFWHDLFRSLKNRPFLLMESALGQVNWKEINKIKPLKADKMQSLQAIAHGSDSVQYFQFRKGRGGTEKFHGAIVDHSGREDTRIFQVAKDIGQTLEKIDEVAGSVVHSRVALIYDWQNKYVLESAQGFNNKDKKYNQTCVAYHNVLWKLGINVDIIDSKSDFSKYDLVIAPMLYSACEKTVEKIEKYVANGGCFYATYLTAMVNENDLCYLGGFPAGSLKKVFGIWNEETDTLWEEQALHITRGDNRYNAIGFAEMVNLTGAKALASYESEFGVFPALTVNFYGKGRAYYQTARDDGEFSFAVIKQILSELKINSNVENLPDGVTAHVRENGMIKYLFVENYGDKKQKVALDGEYLDLITGQIVCEIEIDNMQTKVLKK